MKEFEGAADSEDGIWVPYVPVGESVDDVHLEKSLLVEQRNVVFELELPGLLVEDWPDLLSRLAFLFFIDFSIIFLNKLLTVPWDESTEILVQDVGC